MKTFQYTVKDKLGIHARPAGLLVKQAQNYQSTIMIEKNGKKIDASRLMAVMSLGVKENERVTVTVEGADEDAACAGLKTFFEENL